MLVTCDIDGVAGDVVTALLNEVNGQFGTKFVSEMCSRFKTVENLPERFQEFALRAYHDPRLLQKVLLYPDALWGLQEIVKMGSYVVLMTARGASKEWYGNRSREARKFTYDWIVDNDLPVRGVVFAAPSEKHRYGGLFDASIEDDPVVVNRMVASGYVNKVILMDRPWNRSAGRISGVMRVKDWTGVVEALRR